MPQCIKGFTTMRYINLHFAYLLTYLLTVYGYCGSTAVDVYILNHTLLSSGFVLL